MRRLTPLQIGILEDVGPDDAIHIGNCHGWAYVGGQRLDDCFAQDLLRLLGYGFFRFIDPVRLAYTPEGLEYRQRLVETVGRSTLEIRR